MSYFDFAAERRRAAGRAVLVILLLGGWAAYGRGPIILAAIQEKRLIPQSAPAPVKSRTAVSWLNDGKPIEAGRR